MFLASCLLHLFTCRADDTTPAANSSRSAGQHPDRPPEGVDLTVLSFVLRLSLFCFTCDLSGNVLQHFHVGFDFWTFFRRSSVLVVRIHPSTCAAQLLGLVVSGILGPLACTQSLFSSANLGTKRAYHLCPSLPWSTRLKRTAESQAMTFPKQEMSAPPSVIIIKITWRPRWEDWEGKEEGEGGGRAGRVAGSVPRLDNCCWRG